jgi:hypothetical protein
VKTCTIPEDKLANVCKRNQEKVANNNSSGGRNSGRQQDRGQPGVREMHGAGPDEADSGVGDEDQHQYYRDVNYLEALGYPDQKSKNGRKVSRW